MENNKFYAVIIGKTPGIYQTWEECKKEIDGFAGAIYKSFQEEKNAKKYMEECKRAEEFADLSEAEAVIYSDGSLNFQYPINKDLNEDQRYASYGLIIFFLNENHEIIETYYESGQIKDGCGERVNSEGKKEHSFYIWRYGMNCERVNGAKMLCADESAPEEFWYEDVCKKADEQKHKFVIASGSDVGEVEGVKRGLEICFDEKKLKRVVLVSDLQCIHDFYCGVYDKGKNEPNFYGKVIHRYCSEKNVGLVKVKSHEEQFGDDQIHGVYNDCMDILAKAETNNRPISKKDNPNVAVQGIDIPKFPENDIAERRKMARELLKEVIQKVPLSI